MSRPSKAATEMSYRVRIDRVLVALQQRLDDDAALDMAALAEIACLSPYHFHRIFRGMTGETPAEAVRRMRLHRAAGALAHGDAPIAEIARQAGYGGVEAFSRAFAAAYGAPPARFRTARSVPFPQRPERKEIQGMRSVEEKEVDPISLIAVEHIGPYMEIGTAFERLALWAGGAGLFTPETRMVGVYHDDPAAVPAEKLRSDAALTVAPGTPTPEHVELPVRRVDLPGGAHAVLIHKGPYSDLPATYDWLFGTWLPESGRTPADSPCYEVYLNDPRETPPAELLTEIRLPLAP